MAPRARIVPLIVGLPLFLQNLDTSVMATALPTIASSLQVDPLDLNLAITSYLLSLAIFLPVSGWFAERFGARRVFCYAIAFFSVGSALCGMASSLPALVFFRIIQGLGGAMMLPVGRLILLRTVPASGMVAAMVWFTVPPTIARMLGPLFGGAVVTWISWHWIFLVNVPFGLLAIVLALRYIDAQPTPAAPPEPFDGGGFLLLAVALVGLLGAMETASNALVPGWVSVAAAAFGLFALGAYVLRSRGMASPLVDLNVLRYRTYRASVIGGFPLRIAIGASPFLMPLMLQLGFGMSPLASGLLTVATAIGSLATRPVMSLVIRRLGFRTLLICTTTLASCFYAGYGLFRPDTPHVLMFFTLVLGGLVNSMGLVALASLGFAEVPEQRMSHAATLGSMAQQVSISMGVVLGAALVGAAARWHGRDAAHLAANDFPPAFVFVGVMTLISLFSFVRLRREDGASLR